MTRIITAACLAALLTACAPLPPDSFGNEARPFGIDESAPAPSRVAVWLVPTREDLIVQCHDLDANNEDPNSEVYLSRDGLNCIVAYYHQKVNSNDKLCTMIFVAKKPRDMGWSNAVCSGYWQPSEG